MKALLFSPRLSFLLFFVLAFDGHSQDSLIVPRHEIAFEQGYFNRGLAGLSYTVNFSKKQNTYWSISGGAGAGVLWVGNSGFVLAGTGIGFLTLAPSFQWGKTNKFLSFGLELKNIFSPDSYAGFGAGGYVAFVYNGRKRFIFKFRLGATQWTEGYGKYPYYQILEKNGPLPMFGFSLGLRLGKLL